MEGLVYIITLTIIRLVIPFGLVLLIGTLLKQHSERRAY